VESTGAGSAPAVRVTAADDLPAALRALGLHPPRPAVVVVGGAGGLDEAALDGLRPAFAVGVAPVLERCGAVGVDGGTQSGVMRLFGEARAATRASFPLVGVAAAGLVRLPHERGSGRASAPAALEPHHTHFVIVPGTKWGAEAPWIARVATVLAGGAPSVTVLANGGEIAYADIQFSVDAGRPVVVIAGSGRTADELVAALAGAPADERAAALAESGLIRAVPMDSPGALAESLAAALEPAAT